MSSEKTIISWNKIITDTLLLSKQLKDIDAIITVSRGGCIPGALLAYHLNVKTVVNFAIQSYSDDKTQNNITVLQYPDSEFLITNKNKNVLVVDDLSDKGTTLAFIQRYLNSYKIHPLFCTLYVKNGTALMPDHYIETFDSNIWLEFPWDNLSDSLASFIPA